MMKVQGEREVKRAMREYDDGSGAARGLARGGRTFISSLSSPAAPRSTTSIDVTVVDAEMVPAARRALVKKAASPS